MWDLSWWPSVQQHSIDLISLTAHDLAQSPKTVGVRPHYEKDHYEPTLSSLSLTLTRRCHRSLFLPYRPYHSRFVLSSLLPLAMSGPSMHEFQQLPSRAMTRKSLTLHDLDPARKQPYKTHPRVRGYVDGCFDVMHSGHYNLFRQARMLCDELVVGVHSAAEIEKTKAAAPVQTDAERMRLVGGVKWVDEVVLSTAYSPDYAALLEQYGCDFCIHGSDINLNAEGKDPFAEVKKLGKFRSIERVDFMSTTDIINRLLKATNEDLNLQRRSEAEEDADSYLLTTDRLCQFMNTTRHQPHKPHPGQRVVYVSGSWDLFHSGHVRLLQECKRLGDFLLVGIHEDTTVTRHCGPAFPIM